MKHNCKKLRQIGDTKKLKNLFALRHESSNKQMPEPTSARVIISASDILSKFFELSRISEVSSQGVVYHFDEESHNRIVHRAREQHVRNIGLYEANELDYDAYQRYFQEYMSIIHVYDLLDIDGKLCGTYNNSTKIYELFYRRIELEDGVYYYNDELSVFTYAGICIGRLNEDLKKIVRNYNEIPVIPDVDVDEDPDE